MLYLNSIEDSASSRGLKVAIAREKIPGMQSVPELAPSTELQARFEAGDLSWEEYHEQFLAEMRQEYSKPQSRLRRLAQYSLQNDVTLHSSEPYTDGTYRGILREIINGIWSKMGSDQRVEDLAPGPPAEKTEAEISEEPQILEQILSQVATECEDFTRRDERTRKMTCQYCAHYDPRIYGCPVTERVFIVYEWEEPEKLRNSPEEL